MKRGHLSEYFVGAAVKRLSAVEANPARSNQHEFGTTESVRQFLGAAKRQFEAHYIWIGDEQESFSEDGRATYYDTRESQPHRRPEWRVFYSGNAVTAAMTEGDTLFVALRPAGELLFIVTPPQSTIEAQLLWLFGFESQPGFRFEGTTPDQSGDAALDFAARLILDEIGVEFEDPNADKLDEIISRFGRKFPATVVFSDLARLTLPAVDARDDPDAALVAWLDHEEAMFRRLERIIVAARLEEGFRADDVVDVDGFLSFSLSVQNRRKSRMGRALENHLFAAFTALDLSFTPQGRTEQGNTADFLFPGQAAYDDLAFPATRLAMLASKSTCKERWRQVLPEAARIPDKHLLTLEPGISLAQTDQMRAASLQLVVPQKFHARYLPAQREWLWTVNDFVRFVRDRQGTHPSPLTTA